MWPVGRLSEWVGLCVKWDCTIKVDLLLKASGAASQLKILWQNYPQRRNNSQRHTISTPTKHQFTHWIWAKSQYPKNLTGQFSFALKRKWFGERKNKSIFWPKPHWPGCAREKIIWCGQWWGRRLSQYYGGGTYNAQMADNRIISLLHPSRHSKKSPRHSSSFFFDTVQELAGENIWERLLRWRIWRK